MESWKHQEKRTNPLRAERVRVDARRKMHTRWSGEISIATIKVVDELASEVMMYLEHRASSPSPCLEAVKGRSHLVLQSPILSRKVKGPRQINLGTNINPC